MNDTVLYGRTNKKEQTEKADVLKYVDTVVGLQDEQIIESCKRFGDNSLTNAKKDGFIKEFIKNLSDPIIKVLIAAMLLSIALTIRHVNWLEIGGIAVTVFTSAFVSTFSEYSSGAAFEKLFDEAEAKRCTVIRNGRKYSIPVNELLKYDTVELKAGDVIPCDGFLIQGVISVDESALTGESVPTEKSASVNHGIIDTDSLSDKAAAVFRGTAVVSGSGTVLSTAVGDSTVYGSIASDLRDKDRQSPLKEKLTSLARTISKLGYIGAAIVAAAYLLNSVVISSGFNGVLIIDKIRDTSFFPSELLHAFTLAISIVVVAVPEGLPMMITVVLSANMKRMMKEGVLVRRLVGIETAGCLSILFTDKTGTVTTGKMKVEKVVSADRCFDNFTELKRSNLSKYIMLGNEFCKEKNGGNVTDKALSEIFPCRKSNEYTALDVIPFDSKIKYSAVLLKNTADGSFLTIVRGAPEFISGNTVSSVSSDGIVTNLKHPHYFCDPSLRVISEAVGDESSFYALKNGNHANLSFVCDFLISDEVRYGVLEAAKDCIRAGVQTVMITGDRETTAEAIARKAGILFGRKKVLTAERLHKMSDDELKKELPDIAVISRATPEDKKRLVRISSELGHVVGMTGDGVNDAPALKAADVGFAMGSGTDTAREAGDIVITDDNFVSISKAILYGRTIFESIRKFILFQLTMNFCAVGVSLLGPFFGIECPITITQMLWINIIMDTLGSLAYAGEAPLKHYMTRKPVDRKEPILTKQMVCRVLFCGVYTLSLSMFCLVSDFYNKRFDCTDEIHFLTFFFALFVFCGIAISFCARTSRLNLLSGLSKNKAFVLIMLGVAAVQLMIIYFGGSLFRTVQLNVRELSTAGLLSLTVFPVDFLYKIMTAKARRHYISKKRNL